MSRQSIIPLLACALLVFVGCAESPPPEFVSKEHKFKARFGRNPKRTENVGLTKSTVYSVEQPSGVFRVTITELPLPDDDPPERVSIYLKSAQNDLVRAARGTVLNEGPIALGGKYAGREFVARFAGEEPGVMRVRLFIVRNRLYQVMVVGREDFVNAPAATAFLESFMVTQ